MRHSKGADRPSCLVMNPRNREASAARRTELLAAFDSLDEDTRADLLELVETWSHSGGWSIQKMDAREIVRQVYTAAGWEESK